MNTRDISYGEQPMEEVNPDGIRCGLCSTPDTTDKPRPCDRDKYRKEYDRIFRNDKDNTNLKREKK